MSKIDVDKFSKLDNSRLVATEACIPSFRTVMELRENVWNFFSTGTGSGDFHQVN